MKIAVPYENGAVFAHFGHAAQFKLYTVESGMILHTEVTSTEGSGHSAVVGFLQRNGVDTVIAVNENGDCISPNDVPGYAKDQYMPDEMKDENGKAYAYRDSEGNYYESEFGLSF